MKNKKETLKFLLVMLLTYAVTAIMISFIFSQIYEQENKQEKVIQRSFPKNEDVDIKTLIFNVAGEDGLKIAKCESRFDPKAKNKNSSASGLFQFVNRTWENYCVGDVFDARQNALCFARLYKEHPNWWECQA